MEITPALQEYFDFLQWFAQAHPQLNKDYWQHITIPAAGEGVGVLATDLEPAIYAQLKQIQSEYYHSVASTASKEKKG